MSIINQENGMMVRRLTLLILCSVFILGMMLQFIITEFHTILHPLVMLDLLTTIPLMYFCIRRSRSLFTDILKQNEILIKSHQKLLSAFDVINFGIAIMSPDGTLLNINKKMCRLLGFNQDDVNLKVLEKSLSMDELRNNRKFIESLLEKKLEKYQTIIQCKNRNGDQIWMNANIYLITNKAGSLQYLILQTQKLFSKQHLRTNKDASETEQSVTGVMTLARLEKNVNKLLEAAGDDLVKMVFIYVSANVSADLSRLIGPDGLVTFLQIFSKRLKSAIRETDFVAQETNGDFLVCLTNVNEFIPSRIFKNITNILTSPLIIKGSEIIISVNYGISIYPHDGKDFETCRQHAILAHKFSLSSGESNNYYVFNPDCLETTN